MDDFKKANTYLATRIDWNVPQYIKRRKGDGELVRRHARRKLKLATLREAKEAHHD